jgi:hemerythrin
MIEWNESMSVGVGEFDTHHRRIIELINQLDDSLQKSNSRDVTREVLSELSNYCFYHLFAEEDAMEKCAYQAFEQHKAEHLQFVEKIFQLIDDMRDDSPDKGRELLNFLWHWLKKHIMITDRLYTETLHAGGIF